MSYEYDAFFSYKRDRESDSWHELVKLKLAFWLKQELRKREVKIFFDTEDIRTGARWQLKIASALHRSKCIICIWSPLYFQSKWCISEWMSFVEREQFIERQQAVEQGRVEQGASLVAQGTKCELIVPASYFDGESFPPVATAREFMNFSDFASTMPRFWDTELAVRFETQYIRPFARDLARTIRSAPPWDPRFPIVEAPDEDVQQEGTIGRPADGG
jgi:hypothetical protein